MTKVFPSIPERFFHFSIKLLCSILSYCWVDSRSKFTKLLKKQMFWYNRNIFGPNCIIGQESSKQSLSWGRPRGRRGNPWWRTGSSPTNTWPCLPSNQKCWPSCSLRGWWDGIPRHTIAAELSTTTGTCWKSCWLSLSIVNKRRLDLFCWCMGGKWSSIASCSTYTKDNMICILHYKLYDSKTD